VISDAELVDITKAFKNLEVLRIGWCETVSDEGMATAIGTLPSSITAIHLEFTRSSQKTLTALEALVSKSNLKLVVSAGSKYVMERLRSIKS